jgi:hypothetical protein
MNVVPFAPVAGRGLRSWTSHELETLLSVYEAHAARGDASEWDVGATEIGDPQFYVLGGAPEHECVLAVSRLGSRYVLENGTGRVLRESPSLDQIAGRAKVPLVRKASLVARITIAVATLRIAVEERAEALLAEFEEIILRAGPQLAALV